MTQSIIMRSTKQRKVNQRRKPILKGIDIDLDGINNSKADTGADPSQELLGQSRPLHVPGEGKKSLVRHGMDGNRNPRWNARMTNLDRVLNQHRKPRGRRNKDYYLPLELWDMILPRLPSRTLVRFRCVCKDWCSTIDDPRFVSMQLLQYKNNRDKTHLLSVNHPWIPEPLWRWDVRRLDTLVKTQFLPRNLDFFRYIIYDHLDGVVLLGSDFDYRESIVLLNPSIQKYVELPSFRHVLDIDGCWRFALGFDQFSDDYKVVAITGHGAAVYSLRAGSWKRVSGSHPDTHGCDCGSCYNFPVFMKGAIHWVVANPFSEVDHSIVAFDIQTETFNYIELPYDDGVSFDSGRQQTLAVLGDNSLAVLDVWWNNNFTIWVMEKYREADSWKKICQRRIELGQEDYLNLRSNGEVFMATSTDRIKRFDIAQNRMKTPRYPPLKDCYITTYIESLVLHSQGKSCSSFISRRKSSRGRSPAPAAAPANTVAEVV